MTLPQILYAITISEQGSFNKASEVLYIAQPSLTEAIKELEKELHITIFNRSGRGVTLTSDGRDFISYARELYQQYNNIMEKYGENGRRKKKFAVSTQHYSFAVKSFVELVKKININIFSSVGIILQGYLLAAAAAIILGLLLGSSERLGNVATYIAKFLGAIPPIVYIPYGIALLPTFRSVSVFVIFLATFWPVLAGTMSGVMNVDKKTLDSARVLNVSRFTMLFSVFLPASLPQIFIGCNQGLTVSFVLLTSAEMIGAQSGLGYYIKNYSDFGDYTRTLVGLIVIGIVIVVISFGFNKIQKYLLRWKH